MAQARSQFFLAVYKAHVRMQTWKKEKLARSLRQYFHLFLFRSDKQDHTKSTHSPHTLWAATYVDTPTATSPPSPPPLAATAPPGRPHL